MWTQYDLASYFLASLIIALGATVLNTLLCVPAAYAVARLRFPGRKFAMYLLLMIEMFSPVIVIISLFKVVAGFGMLDTYGALIILDALFTVAFNTWMMNGYFKTIPKDIEEAALIDGCNRVQTMTRIMLPIAVPGLVTVMIYAFIFAWNEFLFALTFISSKRQDAPHHRPVQLRGPVQHPVAVPDHGGVPRPDPGARAVLPHREEARGGPCRRSGERITAFHGSGRGDEKPGQRRLGHVEACPDVVCLRVPRSKGRHSEQPFHEPKHGREVVDGMVNET